MMSGGKPGPSSMIVDGDHLRRSSASCTRDVGLGEIDGVLDQVAEPVDDAGIALADRLRAAPLARLELDRDAEIAMRRDHLLDQRGQRQPRRDAPRLPTTGWSAASGSRGSARSASAAA